MQESTHKRGVDGVLSAGGEPMGDVLDFQEIDQTQVAVVGGKGAVLGELSRIEGIGRPAGLLVTTDAFQGILAELPSPTIVSRRSPARSPGTASTHRTPSDLARRRRSGRRLPSLCNRTRT